MQTPPALAPSSSTASPSRLDRRGHLPRRDRLFLLIGAILVVGAAFPALAELGFRFAEVDAGSLGLWEADRPVLVYRHDLVKPEGVPADRFRSTYIHPLYGLDGEVLTDDFPKDHYHHRGLFWAWPHVGVGGQETDLWMLKGIEQRFVRWLTRETRADAAMLGIENGWYIGASKVMQERVWVTVHPATDTQRAIDFEFTWQPIGKPISLAGAEGKSYGGLTLRFAPRTDTVITTPLGVSKDDLYMTRLAWTDLSARFAGQSASSGAAILVSPDHPDYPPMWLTRHYGVLCLGWPGVESQTFPPDKAIRCGYRVLVHRGNLEHEALAQAYASYKSAIEKGSRPQPVATPSPAQVSTAAPGLRAEVLDDRVRVYAGERLFTEYLSTPDGKYPFFYPVMGPRTGRSVTTCRTEPYPHHSSIFFGCDRVNGGNYWQEGLERGRIASQSVRLLKAAGNAIEFEQECAWQRPDAESPFTDRRRIVITAPTPDRRIIDFDITLRARGKVRIEKTNHSLFSVRMAPELAVTGGGTLTNDAGDQDEKGTFGKPALWADCRGQWGGATEGVTILSHPANRWSPPPWFTRDYGFFSPTPMYWPEGGSIDLEPDETVRLRYRVLVHSDAPSSDEIAALYRAWTGSQ